MKMSNIKKILALVLALVMVFALCACGSSTPAPAESEAPTAEPEAPAVEENNSTLVYATATFGQKFSPFFYTTAYDEEVVSSFTGGLLAADRGGAIIHHGIEGETVEYNGTDYTYYGMGDVEVVQNDDGSVDYNLTMRDDIVFSDGTPATIDDVIFGIYVMADPSYDGSSTVYALPIEGMADYYNSQQYLYNLLAEAGRDNTDFSLWDEATQTAFWASIDAAGAKLAQEVVDSVVGSYNTDEYAATIEATPDEIAADPALQVKFGMNMWGYGDAWTEGATVADFWAAIEANYDSVVEAAETESAGSSIWDLMDDFADYDKLVATGDDVPNIKGIIRTGDYSLTVHMTEYDATAIYNMSFIIAPLHHYGDVSKYDYDNNKFGFDKGDLSHVRSVTTQPMGAGPYKFVKFENGTVNFEANDSYYLGAPKIKYVNFLESQETDKLNGVVTGTIDIADPSFSADTVNAIQQQNSNGELNGDKITVNTVDNLGYGYMGISSVAVNVGGDPGSDASKNLRKGLATVFAVYRELSVESYYGERASVINYPISNTSWAAPRPTDEGYQNCYSKDADGNDLYSEGMSDEQKYEAALQGAISFFKAAGYTFDEATGKFTAAPEGASLTYEIMIPGQGQQDHPTYGVAVAASEALATIGITLQVNDVGTAVWNNALESNTAQMWVAAWQSTADPDMYQVYHSRNAHGKNTNSNHYQIDDANLDELIIAARKSSDTDFRKATYKSAMEIILDWGCELPMYQRKNCYTTSSVRVNNDTMPKDMTPYWVWYAEINTLAVQ